MSLAHAEVWPEAEWNHQLDILVASLRPHAPPIPLDDRNVWTIEEWLSRADRYHFGRVRDHEIYGVGPVPAEWADNARRWRALWTAANRLAHAYNPRVALHVVRADLDEVDALVCPGCGLIGGALIGGEDACCSDCAGPCVVCGEAAPTWGDGRSVHCRCERPGGAA